MSNSATSAAKRRRAGPLLSSPLFQSPQSFQSNKPIVDNNLNLQPEKLSNQVQQAPQDQQAPDSKFMTIQQVINLITTRLISVENFVNEFGDRPRQEVQVNSEPVNLDYNKIAEICKSLMDEHIAEFDHRYAILAEEIANLKNITLNLQNYTLEVNKALMNERLQKNESVKEVVKEEEVPNIEFQFETEQEAEECVVVAESAPEESVDKESVIEESVDKDPFSINIVSKKDKKGKNNSLTSESSEELTL